MIGCACRAAAFDYLCDHIESANLESVAGASTSDIRFLSDILNDPVYAEVIQVRMLHIKHFFLHYYTHIDTEMNAIDLRQLFSHIFALG